MVVQNYLLVESYKCVLAAMFMENGTLPDFPLAWDCVHIDLPSIFRLTVALNVLIKV